MSSSTHDQGQAYRPLEGVRVLDIGMLVPAPLCTFRLAQFGADVVKVEQPGLGDRLRHLPGTGHMFASINRGKRSISLDLTSAEDQLIFLQLAAAADVIVENALPRKWKAVGLDFASLRERRPALIVCSITGYGQTGPLADTPSHGHNIDSLAGSMDVAELDGRYVFTSEAGGANELGSLQAAFAICAAIIHRDRTGEGAWIDASCWDAAVEARRWDILQSVGAGLPETPKPSPPPVRPFSAPYRASDGNFVLLAALEPKFWANFCRRVGRDDLIGAHSGNELEDGPDDLGLSQEIQAIIETATAAEWGRRFIEWDVAGCPILTRQDILGHPHFAARGLLERGSTPDGWPTVSAPIRWHHADQRAGTGLSSVPTVDGDRADILREWTDRSTTDRTTSPADGERPGQT